MKKTQQIIKLVVATAFMFITACTGEKSAEEKKDSLTVALADTVTAPEKVIKLFDSKLFGASNGFDVPVCAELADACIAQYDEKYSKNFDPAFVKKAFTQSATFGSKELGDWIKDIENNTDATSIKIFFGAYTPGMIGAFPGRLSTNKEGRLTVFLWPYNGISRAKYIHPSTYSTGNGCSAANTSMQPGRLVDPFNIAGLEP